MCFQEPANQDLGCVLQAAAVNLAMMIVGRLLAGFAMGALTSVGSLFDAFSQTDGIPQLATLYQAEISPSHVRGMMTASTKFVNNWGFFSANWYVVTAACPMAIMAYTYTRIGYGCQPLTTSAQWRVPLAIQIVPPFILFVYVDQLIVSWPSSRTQRDVLRPGVPPIPALRWPDRGSENGALQAPKQKAQPREGY